MKIVCYSLVIACLAGMSHAQVVYDNGMDYTGIFSSQYEPVGSPAPRLVSELADDFMLTGPNLDVVGVNWIGGYFNDAVDGDLDWRVNFYEDFGDGMKPGALLYTHDFDNADLNESFIEVNHSTWIASYSVVLPDVVQLDAGTKYWVSVQGIGTRPPQTGVGVFDHTNGTGHEAMIRSDFFGFPDWATTSFFNPLGGGFDTTFQILAVPAPTSLALLGLGGMTAMRRRRAR